MEVLERVKICELGSFHFLYRIHPHELRIMQESVWSFHKVQSSRFLRYCPWIELLLCCLLESSERLVSGKLREWQALRGHRLEREGVGRLWREEQPVRRHFRRRVPVHQTKMTTLLLPHWFTKFLIVSVTRHVHVIHLCSFQTVERWWFLSWILHLEFCRNRINVILASHFCSWRNANAIKKSSCVPSYSELAHVCIPFRFEEKNCFTAERSVLALVVWSRSSVSRFPKLLTCVIETGRPCDVWPDHRLQTWRWSFSGVRELRDNFKPRFAF